MIGGARLRLAGAVCSKAQSPGQDMVLLLDSDTRRPARFEKCTDSILIRFLFEPRVCALQVDCGEILI